MRVGDPLARLRYAVNLYANKIVIEYGHKLVGWPTRTLFTSIGNIPGGNRTVHELLKLVNEGKIRFERATPEDIANAKRNPKTVHPNYEPPEIEQEAMSAQAQCTGPHHPATAPSFRTLHPQDLSVIDDDPTSTQSSVGAVRGVRPTRGQRIDTKKPRNRNFSSPYNHKNMLAKEGVKSEPFVFESAAERNCTAPTLSPPAHGEQDWRAFGPLPQAVQETTWIAHTYLNARPSTSYVCTQGHDVGCGASGMFAEGSGAEGN